MSRERRCKVVMIDEEILIRAAIGFGPGLVPHWRIEGLPDGWQVERVHHDFYSKAFAVMISHPSFEPVPEGSMVPRLDNVTVEHVDGWNECKITFREFL